MTVWTKTALMLSWIVWNCFEITLNYVPKKETKQKKYKTKKKQNKKKQKIKTSSGLFENVIFKIQKHCTCLK